MVRWFSYSLFSWNRTACLRIILRTSVPVYVCFSIVLYYARVCIRSSIECVIYTHFIIRYYNKRAWLTFSKWFSAIRCTLCCSPPPYSSGIHLDKIFPKLFGRTGIVYQCIYTLLFMNACGTVKIDLLVRLQTSDSIFNYYNINNSTNYNTMRVCRVRNIIWYRGTTWLQLAHWDYHLYTIRMNI